MSLNKICRFLSMPVFLFILLFAVAMAGNSFAQNSDAEDEMQEIKVRIAEVDEQLTSLIEQKNANMRELRDVAKSIHEYRSDPAQDDPELQDLKARLIEAEKRYRELLAEYNKKLLDQPEVNELQTRKSQLLENSRKVRKELSELMLRKKELQGRLADRKKDDGDGSNQDR